MINIALLTIFIPLIPFTSLVGFIKNASCCQLMLTVAGIIVLIIAIVLLVVAFVYLVKAAGIRGYKRVDLDSIYNEAVKTDNEHDLSKFQIALVSHYYQILRGTLDEEGNCKINEKRANEIEIGMRLTVIGYVALFISTILLILINPFLLYLNYTIKSI